MCINEMKTDTNNQAMNNDYYESTYDRGHLYPVQHTSTYEAMLATSTLTNADPQTCHFNRDVWRAQETKICKLYTPGNPVYIVTGVVPDYIVALSGQIVS